MENISYLRCENMQVSPTINTPYINTVRGCPAASRTCLQKSTNLLVQETLTPCIT